MLALYKLVKVLPQSKFFTLGDSNVIHREEKGTKWRLIDKEIECKKNYERKSNYLELF